MTYAVGDRVKLNELGRLRIIDGRTNKTTKVTTGKVVRPSRYKRSVIIRRDGYHTDEVFSIVFWERE